MTTDDDAVFIEPDFESDDQRWLAVRRRLREADGAFVYSVRTTGVYCRPCCAARLARRENVRFHASCVEAERAGFRPCKRCRPDETGLFERQATAIAKACRLIEEAEETPNLNALAQAVGMSRFHFHRLFKAATGVTPKSYADCHRAYRMRKSLDRSDSVTEAIYEAGFNASSRFYAAAPAVLGMTPSEYRAGGSGTVIRFAIRECSLGAVLVAATDKGVCAVEFGDDPHALSRGLRERFRHAALIGGDGDFELLAAAAISLVENPAQRFDLPLDIRGAAFQQRIWRALRDARSTRAIGGP